MPSKAAEPASGGDEAVRGDAGIGKPAHEGADGAVRARLAGDGGDIAVGGDPSARNPPHGGVHAAGEIGNHD